MVQWFSTSDFESGDLGSNPGNAFECPCGQMDKASDF